MQRSELQNMTVLGLRKLAKENGVKLSAGIDKEGIVDRIAAVLCQDASTEQTTVNDVAAEPETSAPAKRNEDGDQLQRAELSADVTSVEPGSGFRSWNHAQEMNRPVYRQAWQARSAAPRDTAQKPVWQPPQRPFGTANRFGPTGSVVRAAQGTTAYDGAERSDERETSRDDIMRDNAIRENAMRDSVIREAAPRVAPQSRPAMDSAPRQMEGAPRMDGYRLGYRAAPQRGYGNDYNNQGYGGYQQGGYRQNYGYQQRGYQPQGGYQQQGGYQPQGGYQQQGGYQSGYRQPNNYGYQPRNYQPPAPSQPQTEAGFGESVYMMARDPQFAEQAAQGQTPEMLKAAEGEAVQGVLEVLPDGYGFLRGKSLLPGKQDIYVSMAQVRRFGLRTGDFIEGKARAQGESDKYAALLFVEKLNGKEAAENVDRPAFDTLVPVYPNKRIVLEGTEDKDSLAVRLVDLIAPIGFGQRAMIVAPPDSGRLTLLRDISRAIKRSDASAEVLILLIDIAPEEVTEIRESVDAEVFASTFADAPETQTRVSETMLERAMRLVEDGQNVVILLDSLSKLTRAYQAALVQGGRPMTNTVTPAALVRPKRFFGAARNTRDAGSLTVVGTIAVGTGLRVDDIIFEEFKGTANMELYLCSRQIGDPVYPMIDLQKSGTKKEDMLLSDEQQEALRSIRRVLTATTNGEAVAQLIDMIQKTKCNADLLSKLPNWVAMWEQSGYLKR